MSPESARSLRRLGWAVALVTVPIAGMFLAVHILKALVPLLLAAVLLLRFLLRHL